MPLFGVNNLLPLLHISKEFVYINNTEELINGFAIIYMVNPTFHVNKSFKEKVENAWMIRLVQPHNLLLKMLRNPPCVFELVIFYETRNKNAMKYFRLLSCVMYTIIDNYVCIDYLACQSNKLSVICMDRKYLGNSFNKFFGIGIPYLLMNLLSCHGLTKNISYTVILLCPLRMLEYYFPKGLLCWKSIQIT